MSVARRRTVPRGLLGLFFVATLGVAGDPADDAEGGETTPPDAATSPAGRQDAVSLRLRIDAQGIGGASVGRLRLLAERLDNGQRRVVPLAEAVERWPAAYELDDLAAGHYRLTVFWDRDRDDAFDACPFPAMPDHPEQADRFDNLHAVAEAELAGEVEISLTLERHICGPGDIHTGVRGELVPPDDGAIAAVPTYLLLEPLPAAALGAEAAAAMGPTPLPLRVPLFPDGLAEPAAFEVGELVPGTYRLTFFADADHDRRPSPCAEGAPGGGDRFVAVIEAVEVVAGERSLLPAPVSLAEARCSETLTGVRGVLDVEPELVEALTYEGAQEPWSLLAGPVRAALFPPEGSEAVAELLELPVLGARVLPHPFAVSGLPAGSWRLVVWVDRDADGAFTPCNGLPAGLDAVYAVADVRVVDGHMTDLGAVELEQAECEELNPTGLRGQVRVELEPGSVGSGRPLRLELYPVDPSGERRSVQLFENHRELPGLDAPAGARFTVSGALAAGRYRAVAYVDTDRDGDLTSCLDAPFADRAASAVLGACDERDCPRFEIVDGALLDLGELVVRSLGCEVPAASVALEVLSPDRLPPELLDAGALRMQVREAGGWLDDRPLQGRALPGVPLGLPTLRLAPGRYTITVYVDGDEDEHFTACEGGDPLAGHVEVRLDEGRPDAVVSLSLDRACLPH